jgi:DNA-binding NtrC family response regulator
MVDIDPLAMDILIRYHWPGNLRELALVIERAVALCDDKILRPENLCLSLASGGAQQPEAENKAGSDFRARRGHQMQLIERELLERYLRETSGNVSAAARRANLPRRTFYRLMERYDIKRRQFVNRTRPAPET